MSGVEATVEKVSGVLASADHEGVINIPHVHQGVGVKASSEGGLLQSIQHYDCEKGGNAATHGQATLLAVKFTMEVEDVVVQYEVQEITNVGDFEGAEVGVVQCEVVTGDLDGLMGGDVCVHGLHIEAAQEGMWGRIVIPLTDTE